MAYLENFRSFLDSGELSEAEIARLKELSEDEKRENFEIPLEFGTAGMRGILDVGTNRMNAFTVKRATLGLTNYINSLGCAEAERGVVISYDTRKFSAEFACLCAGVLSKNKIRVYLFENVRPVPLCSYAIRRLNAFGGIMITASHNPKIYNGYKVYGGDGAQLSPEATAGVVEFINKLDYFKIDSGASFSHKDIAGKDNFKIDEYITVIGKSVDEDYYSEILKLSLSPNEVKAVGKDYKIVYTPIHGSGYKPVCEVLRRAGINPLVVAEQADPDPDFPTVRVPNPEEPDALKLAIELAKRQNADLVIGTDPDCDRMGVAVKDTSGQFVLLNGNQIGSLLCDYILSRRKEQGTLPDNAAIVKTIVTTELARSIAKSYGAAVFDVLTGFKFIGEKIKEWEKSGDYAYIFGYEESYGYLCGTHARDKDAVVSSLLFAELACYLKSIGSSVYERLQALFEKHGYFAEKSISITYGGLDGMLTMKSIMQQVKSQSPRSIAGQIVAAISNFDTGVMSFADGNSQKITLPKTNAVKYHMANGDWICIRPSGTEPKLKIYVAAKAQSQDAAQAVCENYFEAMKKILK
jgi:phosphoglucomutase